MRDFDAARRDLGAFAELAGQPLAGFQARALGLEQRTTAIVAPRQSGKSRSLGVLAVWWAFRQPGQRVLIVSSGEEASRRLLGEVRRLAVGSPLLAGSVVDETASLITLSNGSEVRSVPASERQVRGWTVDLLLVDEAAMVPDDLLLGAAIPTTAARPEARVVLASSATVASGAFYDAAMRGEAGSDHTRTFRWSLTDAEWISPTVVAAARESMTALRFAAEYEGVFASGSDALFTRDALAQAAVDYVPDELEAMRGPARVLTGHDWGAVHDSSTLVAIGRLALVGGERLFGVRCAKRWQAGYPLPLVLDETVGSPVAIDTAVIEVNGLGLPLGQELKARLARRDARVGGRPEPPRYVIVDDGYEEMFGRRPRRRPLLPIPDPRKPYEPPFTTRTLLMNTSAPMKAAGYSALRMLIERRQLLLPASATELLRELLLLRVDLTPSGTERVEAGSGHDDLADALMLATLPYKSRRDGRWRSYLTELADVRRALPAPDVDAGALERLTAAAAPGAAGVPRTPAWASIRGPEVTLPAGVNVADPATAYRARRLELERRVRAANTP